MIMADNSAIEWTNTTWNPVTGCTKIGPGCDHCYAERSAERFRGVPGHPYEPGFDLTLRPDRLEWPARWQKPRMIFVNSMSDLFHKQIPVAYVDQVFESMERADHHTYQVLTKRSSRLRSYINMRYAERSPPDHIWLGVSIEDRRRLSRLVHLRQIRAPIRFLSLEPLLGPLGRLDLDGIHWVIVGGESGPGARAMEGSACQILLNTHFESGRS
ncbi:MAG TPA: phage Gp37/Gp68 family protein [Alphaproteobacteria bacterium]|jgi:protein gp37|nr:phage Gp37/Gp68 family protein [Alphaproteobacteria bacterium]|tara:strand:+ start:353 stop:994 length:642 start_codon:yes stop_codon:yes gene_type:complete